LRDTNPIRDESLRKDISLAINELPLPFTTDRRKKTN
jgi:hypothetical protein